MNGAQERNQTRHDDSLDKLYIMHWCDDIKCLKHIGNKEKDGLPKVWSECFCEKCKLFMP